MIEFVISVMESRTGFGMVERMQDGDDTKAEFEEQRADERTCT